MQRVRAGDLKPQEVVDAHLDAIDRFDSRIHAYIHVDRKARTTSGVTLAVKDSQPVAGMPYTYGTPSWRDRIAEVDAAPVARARSSGMAILGKTNLPELAASIGTTNTMFPPTQNPWRAGTPPAGARGGRGAAGAARACQDACRRAAKALENAGHEIQEIKWDPEPVTEGYAVVRRASMASFPADLSTLGPGIRKLAEEGRSLTAMDYFHAFELATNAANRAVAVPLQTRYDFLLTPTLGLPPIPIEKVPPFLGEEWARHVQFVLPVTFARSPAISIPAGLHAGLPIGVQLVGQFGQEYDLLDFAEQLEQMPGFGFLRPPEMEVTG